MDNLELYRPTYTCVDFDDRLFQDLALHLGKRFLIIDFHQTLFWIRQKVGDPVRLTALKRWLENGWFDGIAILCNAVIPGYWTKHLAELTQTLERTGARIYPVELILPWELKPGPLRFS